ncbi:YheC/YheD family endospore coat-associated protein [Paenibacillus glycanilyticus]|uniref:YheC/YheD family endospore coat-associated protein n=1 Tax=Paenibacillus glycanilyticus TaxID=126569 RepID=UPI00190FDE33|nr:YheC/YheD family protein [Paenibacillus glycanilyticus]
MELRASKKEEVYDRPAGRLVLAILTIENDEQFFRGNRNNFADIIKTGQEKGFLVYVLTVKNLVLNRSTLQGFVYIEQKDTWQQRLLPFPDIIYNRIPQREDEMLPAVRNKIAACMRDPRIKLFNPSFFNKWYLFEWLRGSKSTKPFIPATRKLLTAARLERMLQKHPFLYLKPESGKAGKGIMTVMVQPDKPLPYLLKVQENKKSSTFSCADFQKLWNRIKKECGSEPYIAQQGIQLASFNDRRFDLRALVQKNDRGKWDLTGIGARVAGSSSITTHVPRGGSIEDPEKLLKSSFNADQARRILIKAKQTSIMIARQIEKGSGFMLGEMSMDLGIDSQGHIWFFEANSKPMKFDEPHIRQKSLERIFQYSTYLARMRNERIRQEATR